VPSDRREVVLLETGPMTKFLGCPVSDAGYYFRRSLAFLLFRYPLSGPSCWRLWLGARFVRYVVETDGHVKVLIRNGY